MVYGYVRVSTDKQTVENQRFEIARFCSNNNMVIDHWKEETISGTQLPEKRLLGSLLTEAKTGDLIICSELSRLGRSMLMIMSILNHLMENGIKIQTIKDNFRLEDGLQAKVIAFAFSLTAEIERNLISQRTKEALFRKKSEGCVLGRPKGSTTALHKLVSHEAEIQSLLGEKVSKSAIARRYGVCRKTLYSYLKNLQENT